MEFFAKLKPFALLFLRLAIGTSLIVHGREKLHNIDHFIKLFPGWGFPSYFAYIASYLEVIGGSLLVLGLFTRGIGLILAIEMGFVVGRAMIPTVGIFAYKLYEVPLMLGTASLLFVAMGAGLFSLDAFTLESKLRSVEKT